MNYRHAFHAGNFADVFKHVIETLILEYLCSKPKGFTYIDTHAGIGLYDLTSEAAKRSPEYQNGISRILQLPNSVPELATYLRIIKFYQQASVLRYYPGSPQIANYFLREQDQMILNEYHPEDFLQLKNLFSTQKNCHCHHRDAYEFLPAVLPPTPRRGLILIDPPFEQENEFRAIANLINKAMMRFEQGIYMLWYPIASKDHQKCIDSLLRKIKHPLLHTVMTIKPTPIIRQNLIGNGVIIINPPWQLEKMLKQIIPFLWQHLRLSEDSYYLVNSNSNS